MFVEPDIGTVIGAATCVALTREQQAEYAQLMNV